jgi:hypothetical protein
VFLQHPKIIFAVDSLKKNLQIHPTLPKATPITKEFLKVASCHIQGFVKPLVLIIFFTDLIISTVLTEVGSLFFDNTSGFLSPVKQQHFNFKTQAALRKIGINRKRFQRLANNS